MSFICGFCGKPQPAGTKPDKIVTEVRLIPISPAQEIDPETGLIRVFSRDRREIVKEVLSCPFCALIPKEPKVIEVIERRC